MLTLKFKVIAVLALCGLTHLSFAQALKVEGVAPGVKEIDLYDVKSGQYLKSIQANELPVPLAVKEERALGFVISLKDGSYYVGASDVITNKVYDTTALCDSQLAGPTGASRGIAGKGCK